MFSPSNPTFTVYSMKMSEMPLNINIQERSPAVLFLVENWETLTRPVLGEQAEAPPFLCCRNETGKTCNHGAKAVVFQRVQRERDLLFFILYTFVLYVLPQISFFKFRK